MNPNNAHKCNFCGKFFFGEKCLCGKFWYEQNVQGLNIFKDIFGGFNEK